MVKIVVWSGGLDSTLALYKTCLNSKHSETIKVLSITANMNHQQLNQEKQSRTKILKELKNQYFKIKELNIDITSKSDCIKPHSGLILQPMWAIYSMPYLFNEDELIFGYILKDDYWRFRREIEEALNNICIVMGKKIKFKYPIEKYNKFGVIKELKKAKLLHLCWTCDSPVKRKKQLISCGKCEKCIERKVGQYHLDLMNKYNPETLAKREKKSR